MNKIIFLFIAAANLLIAIERGAALALPGSHILDMLIGTLAGMCFIANADLFRKSKY